MAKKLSKKESSAVVNKIVHALNCLDAVIDDIGYNMSVEDSICFLEEALELLSGKEYTDDE